MKALVTGATGHVGTVLIKALREKGADITAFVLPSQDISIIEPFSHRILYGDVMDLQSLIIACRGIDIVFHTAGIVDITCSLKSRKRMRQVNIDGVRNIIEAVRVCKVSRLVYISSVHALKETPRGEPIEESRHFDPDQIRGSYAKTKAAGTRLVLEAADQGLDAIIVHPSGIIGPDDYRMGHMASMVATFLRGTLNVYTSGGYNFVDVRDVADGIIKAGAYGKRGECYILSGEYHTVRELFHILKELSGSRKRLTFIPRWVALAFSPFTMLHYRVWNLRPLFTPYALSTLGSNSNFSNAKAVRELQYQTRTFRRTVEDTINWCRSSLSLVKKGKEKRS